jgi:hypothetical protein
VPALGADRLRSAHHSLRPDNGPRRMNNDWSGEETTEPLVTDHRNYYKVEKWTKAGRFERPLYAGNNPDKAVRYPPRQSNTGRGSGSPCGNGRACCSSGRRNEGGSRSEQPFIPERP